MSFQEEFTALRCPQCGGEVKIGNERLDNLFYSDGAGWIFIGGGTAQESCKCAHCGTAFVRKGRYREVTHGGPVVAARPRSVAIGGNVSDSVIITGGDA